MGKQAAQRFDRQRFNLRKLNEPEVREQYQIEITNRFAALENSDDDEDVNRTWENIKENIQTSAKESLGLHELKQNKPWFDEECLGFLDQRKWAKMQWIQDPSQSNVDILNNVRRQVSRRFRNKKKTYLRAKIEGRLRNYSSQIFNMHGVKDVGQAEIHTAEPLIPEPSASEVELAIDKLNSHKLPGIDQIPAELIKAGGRTI